MAKIVSIPSSTEIQSEINRLDQRINNIGGGATTAIYTASLSTTWSGSSAPYTQTVAVTGILATDTPIIDVIVSATTATGIAQMTAWACVSRVVTANNSITAYCYETKPTTAIPIQLKVIR